MLLELQTNKTGTIPDAYFALLPCLLAPVLWERPGNVKPLVRLLQAAIVLGPVQIVENNFLVRLKFFVRLKNFFLQFKILLFSEWFTRSVPETNRIENERSRRILFNAAFNTISPAKGARAVYEADICSYIYEVAVV